MTNHPIPRITPAQESALQMALSLRMPEGHQDCGWHRDDAGRPMLWWLGWWCEALGEPRSRVQRALTALEKLAPGCLTRRRGDSALVHLDVLDAAVAAAPEGSALALVREAEARQREMEERQAATKAAGMEMPEDIVQTVRQAVREKQARGRIVDTGDITHLADTVIRLGIRTMSGSIYEFEPALCRARYVSGPHGPTSNFAPAGSWHKFRDCSMPSVGSRVRLLWDDERFTTLTPTAATWAIGIIDPLGDLPPLVTTDEQEVDG